MEYKSLSDALVNIRYACTCAVKAHVISAVAELALIDAAASLPFYERSYQGLVKLVPEEQLSRREAEEFLVFVQQEQFNLKKQDALEMMHAAQTYSPDNRASSFEWHETSHAQSWRVIEQGDYVEQDMWVSNTEALAAYQLFDRDYPRVHSHLLIELLADIASRSFYGAAQQSYDDRINLVARYVAARCGLNLEQAFPASVERWIHPTERTMTQKEQLARVAVRLWIDRRGADWREAMLDHLKKSERLNSMRKLVAATHAFNKELWGSDASARCSTIRPERIYAWFQQHWGVTETDFEFALLDRGFSDMADFLDKASSFYMFDKLVGVENWKRSASSLVA